MANINGKGIAQNSYDAIVVGSGVSGGWAAKELCEKGLKTIVLERGRDVKHGEYPTAFQDSWDMENRGVLTAEENARHFKQVRTGFMKKDKIHWFVDDKRNPYQEDKRFDWIRGYHTGGRSLTWGRQCYRWSEMDFEANAKEGIAIDWPIRYKDIAPWYDYVEGFVGISGQKMGLPQLPDGVFQKPMDMNCLEKHVKERIEKEFPGRYMTIGRSANLTEALNGRGPCQFRNRCVRGCPYGAYFSSNSTTLPAAENTGNLTLRPYSIVTEVIYDSDSGKAKGVRIVDQQTRESIEYFASVIFLNASAIGSTAIMLNSKSDRFPDGLGNDSGELGHNLMDHHFRIGAAGVFEGMEDQYYTGRRPNGIYIPRFRNLDEGSDRNYVRGFGYQGRARRMDWNEVADKPGFGAEFKDSLIKPGSWYMSITGFGECLPYHENRMYLHKDKTDEWGMPVVVFDAGWKQNELNMRIDMGNDAAEMLEASGLKDVEIFDYHSTIGEGIHEMGTARMGDDPKTAVLNGNNQVHGAPNVYVTDGACMTSASCVNPSITYMALTARASNHAVEELKKGNI